MARIRIPARAVQKELLGKVVTVHDGRLCSAEGDEWSHTVTLRIDADSVVEFEGLAPEPGELWRFTDGEVRWIGKAVPHPSRLYVYNAQGQAGPLGAFEERGIRPEARIWGPK